MKTNLKRYQQEQIIYALRQVEGGRKIAKVYREMDLSSRVKRLMFEPTFMISISTSSVP